MDIKEKIAELVEKIKGDGSLLEKFKKDPMGTIKGLVSGIDLPDEQIKAIVEGVKAKINAEGIGDKIGSIGEKITGIFKK